MFKWLKQKKTLDEIISESFSEQGRWIEESKNIWVDSKTNARLFVGRSGQLSLNNVPVSVCVHTAFYAMVMAPYNLKKKLEVQALKALYDTNS